MRTILAVSAVLANLIAFGRDAYIVSTYGAGQSDLFFLAITIPLILTSILTSTYGTVFLPVYTSVKQDAGEVARFVGANVTALTVGCGVVILLTAALRLQVGQFFGYPVAQADLIGGLTLILSLTVLLMAIGQILGNVLNANGRYVSTVVAPVLNNLTTLVVTYWTKSSWGLYGVGWAFVFGAGVFLIVHLTSFLSAGFRFTFGAWSPRMRHVTILLMPLLISALLGQFNQLFDRWIASGLPEGSVTSLSIAFKIVNVPIIVLVLSAMRVFFPQICEYRQRSQPEQVAAATRQVLFQVLFWILPISGGLLVLAPLLIKIVFERGEFTPGITALTSGILQVYACGLPFMVLRETLTKNYYADQNTKVPTIISIGTMALNVGFVILLLRPLGVYSIPAGFVISHLVNNAVLMIMLPERPLIFTTRTLYGLAKLAAATVAMMGATAVLRTFLVPNMGLSLIAMVWLVGVPGIVYIGLTALLRVAEHPVDILRRRLQAGG